MKDNYLFLHLSKTDKKNSIMILLFIMIATFIVILLKVGYMQIFKHNFYQHEVNFESVHKEVVYPIRGNIYDRNNVPLTTNDISIDIELNMIAYNHINSDEINNDFNNLSHLTNIPISNLKDSMTLCKGYNKPYNCYTGDRYSKYRPIIKNASKDIVFKVLEDIDNYSCFTIKDSYSRDYTMANGSNAENILGNILLNNDHYVGSTGIEKFYDKELSGSPTVKEVYVNSIGEVMKEKTIRNGNEPNNIRLTIDSKLQGYVEGTLYQSIIADRNRSDNHGIRYKADNGASIVMDVHGNILAMASYPSFSINSWNGGIINNDIYKQIQNSKISEMINYATQSIYSPGSAFKVVTTTAMSRGNIPFTTTENCNQDYVVNGYSYENFEGEDLGSSVNLTDALVHSCNTYFYAIADQMYKSESNKYLNEPIEKEAEEYGFGKKTGIDLPNEGTGTVIDSNYKKEECKHNKKVICTMLPGDYIEIAVGAGGIDVTPIQMADLYQTIANYGDLYQNHLLDQITSYDNKNILFQYQDHIVHSMTSKSSGVYSKLNDMLYQVSQRGTSSGYINKNKVGIDIDSKTGTSDTNGNQAQGWLCTFAPKDSPQYIVIMTIHQAGIGAVANGEGIKDIYSYLRTNGYI